MSELETINAVEKLRASSTATLAAAGLTAAALLYPRAAKAVSPALTFEGLPGTGDVKVLNYALVLEDLESALYRAALARLTAIGGTAASGPLFTYLTTFSRVETDHALFLRNGITAAGGTPVRKPADTEYSFGLTAATQQQVLDLVLQAEATGVRAYLGAIPLFSAKSAYLPVAAAIQGTEARHTTTLTIVRNQLFGNPILDTAPLASDASGAFGQFSYDTQTGGYNSARPNEGYRGIDVHLSPNVVLQAVSPFFVNPL